MKRTISIVLTLLLVLSLCACGSNGSSANETAPSQSLQAGITQSAESVAAAPEITEPYVQPNEEELIDDAAWDELESLGRIETENGLFYVSITMPAEFVGSDITQESIDANAGETYTSGKLNEDGSVTYKMTKKQHKAMLDLFAQSIEEGLQELVDSSEYAFTKITHNDDFTQFDAYLSTEEVGFTEGFMAMGFYMYGGMYSLFTGRNVDNISVNYYSASGNLISTANSSEMGG